MTRRQVLHRIAVLLGGAVSAPVFAAAMGNSRSSAADPAAPRRTLDAQQDRLVTALAEAILPATHTPGAEAAGVNRFVDLIVSEWLSAHEREHFLAGLAQLEAGCHERFGRSFLDLTAEEQLALLEPLDAEATEIRAAAFRSRNETVEELPFFGMMKEMTLVGYYTSEIGMRQELGYRGFSGSYAGCVPLSEIG